MCVFQVKAGAQEVAIFGAASESFSKYVSKKNQTMSLNIYPYYLFLSFRIHSQIGSNIHLQYTRPTLHP